MVYEGEQTGRCGERPSQRHGNMQQPTDSRRVGALDLFTAFTRITLTSFGGALFWSRRAIVERHRWLTEHEFVEILALAQLLPGANGVNLAVLIGYRFDGVRGAFASLAGFLAAPFAVIMALGLLHRQYGELPVVHAARRGLTPITIGLIFASAWILLPAVNRDWRGYVLTALTVFLVSRTRLNPIWVLVAGAAAGVAGFV